MITRKDAIMMLEAASKMLITPGGRVISDLYYAYKMAIRSLKVDEAYDLAYEDATEAGRWIDVHDALPCKGVNDFVLCCFRNGYIDTCTLGYLMENDNIVAWMPLPEPYHKGVQDDS